MAMSTKPPQPLSPEAKEAYQRDGFLIVRGLFEPREVAGWRRRFEELLKREDYTTAKGRRISTSGIRVWKMDEMDREMVLPMVANPLCSVLTGLIGPDVEFLSQKIVFKAAKTAHASFWHQDHAYWKGTPKISVWIPLDPATKENGCLRIIPGSHGRIIPHHQADGSKEGLGERLGEDQVDEAAAVSAEVAPGDAIFFHDLVVHSSHPNTNGLDRWALIPTFRSGALADDSPVWSDAVVAAGESVNGARPVETLLQAAV